MQHFIGSFGYLAIFVLMVAESACIPVPSELPVIRTFISLPAGFARMPPVHFGIYTAAGCVPWIAGLAWAGYSRPGQQQTPAHSASQGAMAASAAEPVNQLKAG